MFYIIVILIVLVILCLLFMKIKFEIIVNDEVSIEVSILKYIKVLHLKYNDHELKEIESTSKKVAKEEVRNYIKNIEFTDAKLFIKNIKELLSKVKYEKIDFKFNINLDDYILNSYIVAFVNSVIAIIISKNINRINTDNLDYIITSNENKIKLNLKCIIYGRIANIMFVMLKVLYYAFKLKKRGNDKDGKRTSNRKFNGNSHVIARGNG